MIAIAITADRLRKGQDREHPTGDPHDEGAPGFEQDKHITERNMTARDLAFVLDLSPAFVSTPDQFEAAADKLTTYLAGLDAERTHRLFSWADWNQRAFQFVETSALAAFVDHARNGDEYAKAIVVASVIDGVLPASAAQGVEGVPAVADLTLAHAGPRGSRRTPPVH